MKKNVKSFVLGIATGIGVLLLIIILLAWYSIAKRNNKETKIHPPSGVVSYFNVFHLTNNLPVKIEDAKCKFMTLPGHVVTKAVFFQASQDALIYMFTRLKTRKKTLPG